MVAVPGGERYAGHMPQPDFEQPLSLGTDFVDPKVFPELLDVFEDERVYGTYDQSLWPGDLKSDYASRVKIQQILAGVTQNLQQFAEDAYGKTPTGIFYNVHTHAVAPGRRQTEYNGDHGRWHIDALGRGSLGALNVATALPTEFLVKSTKSGCRTDRMRKRFEEIHGTDFNYTVALVDKVVKGGAYEIFQPENYEAVIMRSHVHQASKNMTDSTLGRVWLRGIMTVERSDDTY